MQVHTHRFTAGTVTAEVAHALLFAVCGVVGGQFGRGAEARAVFSVPERRARSWPPP